MDLIAVGDRYPGFTLPRPESTQFQIDKGGPKLVFWFESPTAEEVRGARRGRMKLGLLPGGQHTLFLLVQCEGLLKGWADSPYAFGLVPPDWRAIPPRQPHQGWLFQVILADRRVGTIKALRNVSVTPAFSARLDAEVAKQRAALAEFSEAAHQREIDAVYRRYPDIAMMVKDAVITEEAGMPFPR